MQLNVALTVFFFSQVTADLFARMHDGRVFETTDNEFVDSAAENRGDSLGAR
jgi:hypothetical protein